MKINDNLIEFDDGTQFIMTEEQLAGLEGFIALIVASDALTRVAEKLNIKNKVDKHI